jgi:hypothetical protein
MITETDIILCSFCRQPIVSGDRFVLSTETGMLRLHPHCVAKLSQDLAEWISRYAEAKSNERAWARIFAKHENDF